MKYSFALVFFIFLASNSLSASQDYGMITYKYKPGCSSEIHKALMKATGSTTPQEEYFLIGEILSSSKVTLKTKVCELKISFSEDNGIGTGGSIRFEEESHNFFPFGYHNSVKNESKSCARSANPLAGEYSYRNKVGWTHIYTTKYSFELKPNTLVVNYAQGATRNIGKNNSDNYSCVFNLN